MKVMSEQLQTILDNHKPAFPIAKVTCFQDLYPISEPDDQGNREWAMFRTIKTQYPFENDARAKESVEAILAQIDKERLDAAAGHNNPHILRKEFIVETREDKGRVVRDEIIVSLPPGDPEELIALGYKKSRPSASA